MPYQPAKRERTFSVVILAVLTVIAGLLSFLDAIRYMGWLPIATFGDMRFVLPQAPWFAAVMAAIVGVIFFFVARWLWSLNPSGRLFVVVITIFNLIFLFLAILGRTSFNDVLWQVVVNALALILALLPSTKQAFTPVPLSSEQVRVAADKAVEKRAAAVGTSAGNAVRGKRSSTQPTGVNPEQQDRRKDQVTVLSDDISDNSQRNDQQQSDPDPIVIFLSYRREDSADVVGRIYDRLSEQFGQASIFMDVDAVPLGVDFRDHLDQSVKKCDVLIAVIGDNWLTATDADAKRRLDSPKDFVRIEIESALRRGIPIIPVLVRGAEIPAEEELPSTLKSLAYRNGIRVRPNPDFHQDMNRLIAGLEQISNNRDQ